MLNKGGILVYSTCSLAEAQNEHIVSWFLSNNAQAVLLPITEIENNGKILELFFIFCFNACFL
jgi:16S rRNA C967 or C1407 C5-methylase (RsmB/RsmF family)